MAGHRPYTGVTWMVYICVPRFCLVGSLNQKTAVQFGVQAFEENCVDVHEVARQDAGGLTGQ